jgi:hypothetical protein
MESGLAAARPARVQPRHELSTLTYVTIDQANGGIVRNLSRQGIGAQVVGAVRPQQQIRVRFDLRGPRLRVETRGEVTWATFSGQCDIRFLDLSPKMASQIDQWIFGNLLEGASLHSEWEGSIFAGTFARPSAPVADPDAAGQDEEDDGLMVSASPVNVIELPARNSWEAAHARAGGTATAASSELDWLSQSLSGRGLVWTVNTLVIVAALLLFALIFLSITGEAPRWPLATAGAAAMVVAALYWGFFRLLGGISPGARLARMAGWDVEDEEATNARFR